MASSPARDFSALKSKVKRTVWGCGSIAHLITSSTYAVTVRDFTLLIMGCKKQCEWLKALEIFDVLRKVGAGQLKLHSPSATPPAPNFYSYSAVVSVCCKTGALPAALNLLCLMKEESQKDKSLAPDKTTYRQLITAAKRWRNMELVLVLFGESKERGLQLDQQCLRCCLEADIELGRWGHALDVMDEVLRTSSSEDAVPGKELHAVFEEIVSGCARSGEVDLAVEALLTMQVLELEPGEKVLNAVMMAAERAEDVQLAEELYQELWKKTCEVPDQVTASFVRLLEKSGNWEYAQYVAGRGWDMKGDGR